ncbi:MAG: hypothetical protein GEU90_16870 [Gemmatimonas sp.]|nr:hypothetical protein [Gemmatimonas sp.]
MARKLSPKQLEKRLRECQKQYARIKARIRDVGFICEGSLVERWTSCGKPNCRCTGDPPQRHGPYYQLTWKEQGKTVTRRLAPEQAQLYQEWITNRRELEALLQQMREVSWRAGDYLLQATRTPGETSESPSRPPKPRT